MDHTTVLPPDMHGFQRMQEVAPDSLDAARDARGYTNPNLDRRIAKVDPIPEGALDTEYELFIQGSHSYRLTTQITHDEESTTSEIP